MKKSLVGVGSVEKIVEGHFEVYLLFGARSLGLEGFKVNLILLLGCLVDEVAFFYVELDEV